MTIKEVQNEIVEEFSLFEDWKQRYEYIIELGKSIALLVRVIIFDTVRMVLTKL